MTTVKEPQANPAERRDAWAARALWALAGLVAGWTAIAAAEVLAVAASPSSAPLVAVGAAAVDRVPPGLKNWAIATFGTADKTVLLTGAALVVALFAAGCGLLARRSVVTAQWAVLALGAVAALAAATRPDATMLAVVPSIVGVLVGAWVLRLLADRLAGRDPVTGAPLRRRSFLTAAGVAAGSGVVIGGLGWWLGRDAQGAEISRAAVKLPPPASVDALTAGVELGVPGVAPFRVPNADFYRIDTALVVPRDSTQGWRLRIHGMVEREVTLDYATLMASPLIERDVTLCCVSNEVGGNLIGNARWLGLPIGPLLRQAGPSAGADMVLSTSSDGWTAGTPLPVLMDGRDALLAIGMNGQPLPIEHGFPVRMVVPGLYGYVSATKWVVDLEVTRFDRRQGYWTPRGWSALGPVKTESRIDVPLDGDRVKRGQVAVAGVAWAQHRGIRGVEVRVDDGPWQQARLGAEDTVDTWRQWVYAWDATPGKHRLQVRSTDRTGVVQTEDVAPPEPDGATGWHTIGVTVA